MTVDAAQTELIVTVARVAGDALIGAVVVGVACMTAARPEDVVVALQALAVLITVLVFLLSAAPISDDLAITACVPRVIADARVVTHHMRAVAVVTARKLRRVKCAEIDVSFAVFALIRGPTVNARVATATKVALVVVACSALIACRN